MSVDRPDYIKPIEVIGTVTITGTVNISGTVTVTGAVTVTGTVSISGTVTVTGTVAISGTVTVTGAVIVTGTVSISGTVTVTGTVAVSGTVTVTGAVTVTGTVAVSGTVTVSGSVTVSGTVAISGTVTVSGAVTVTGTVAISGTVTITGAVTVTGDVNITNATLNVLLTNDAVTMGQAKPALSFDGSNDYVTFGDVLGMIGTQAFTVVIRAYLTAYTGTGRSLIGKLKLVGASEGWFVELDSASNVAYFQRLQNDAADSVSSNAFTAGWHTIVVRYNGTTMYIRLDSGTDVTTASSKSVQTHTYPLTLGCRSNLTKWLNDLVSHLLIWTRFLSDAEATAIVNNLNSPPAQNLVLWPKINEGTGTSLADSSPSGYTGTISGALWVSSQGAVAPTVNINITAQTMGNLTISIVAQTVDITVLAPSGKRVMSGIGLPMKTASYTGVSLTKATEYTMFTLTGRGRIGTIGFSVIGKDANYSTGGFAIKVYNNGEGTASYIFTESDFWNLDGSQLKAKALATTGAATVTADSMNPRGSETYIRKSVADVWFEAGGFVCPDIEFETSSTIKVLTPSDGAASQWNVYASIMYGYYP